VTGSALTPRQIVEALDRHIIGQAEAKRAVAVAVRNRWRRQQLPESMRDEVGPKNLILIGPTGVGKTEIARRLAWLVNAPWVKVEASKYTEVGYHGRDVESMIRDLVENAIHMVRTEQAEVVRSEAERLAEEQLLDALMPPGAHDPAEDDPAGEAAQKRHRNREKLRAALAAGELDDRSVDLTIEQKALPVGMFATVGAEPMDADMQGFLEKLLPSRSKARRVVVAEARKILFEQECDKLIDRDKVIEMAVRRAENSGIIFLDEIDKIVGSGGWGPDVSRQGVQRDLLPVVEGSTVNTRYGLVKTDHILFIAAGAFHTASPNDMMPELQGRFPIRVELKDLTREDLKRILTEPESALTKQQVALMATEGVEVHFLDEAIEEMADLAVRMNEGIQNIGARRLYTIAERLMEDLSFTAPDQRGQRVVIDAAYVRSRLEEIVQSAELSRFGFHSLRRRRTTREDEGGESGITSYQK
jgi:ATP-dependent HslUV protease ATP-binding subunit HslU